MTYQRDCTLPTEFLKQLTEQGLESLPELIRVLVNEAMQMERQNYLRAKPYERTTARRGAREWIQAKEGQDPHRRDQLRYSASARGRFLSGSTGERNAK